MLGSSQPRSCTNFFSAHHPSLKKGSIRLISSTHCSRTHARAPEPFRVTCSLCFQLLNAKEIVRREKHWTGIQLKKCHPLIPCTSVSSFSQIITGFSAPSFLGFNCYIIFMIPPNISLVPQSHRCSLLNQTSDRGG